MIPLLPVPCSDFWPPRLGGYTGNPLVIVTFESEKEKMGYKDTLSTPKLPKDAVLLYVYRCICASESWISDSDPPDRYPS
jgi:hypothetical protein